MRKQLLAVVHPWIGVLPGMASPKTCVRPLSAMVLLGELQSRQGRSVLLPNWNSEDTARKPDPAPRVLRKDDFVPRQSVRQIALQRKGHAHPRYLLLHHPGTPP